MYLSAPVNKIYQPKIKIGQGIAELEIQVRNDFFHSAGSVHGAIPFKMLDDAAFFAVSSLVENVFIFTVSFNLYFLRPVSSGELISRGKVLHQSERLYLAEASVHDSDGRKISHGSGTFMPSRVALTMEVGYV
jgi:uncharacterized protein (TIGR00369 family)